MNTPGFFGGDSGITYEELQARKKIARELMGGNGTIRNVGEGINSAAGSIAGALMHRRAAKAEEKMRGQFQEQLAQTVGPQAASVSGLADSPFANDAQKKMIVAALAGVPQFARGTNFAPGGVALVGEQGPEFVNIPRGAQVIPAQATDEDFRQRDMDIIRQAGPGFFSQPLDQAVGALGWQMDVPEYRAKEYDAMTPEERLEIIEKMIGDPGMSLDDAMNPDGWSPHAQNSFNDAAAYQVAENGPLSVAGDQFQTDEAPTLRKLEDRELGQRNAVNALQQILIEVEENPQLLDDVHTITGRGQTGFLKLRDRLGIEAFDISPEGEQRLGDAAAYRQKLLTNVNEYIKEITGATVGQGDETTRLMGVQPNEGDSPTELVSKLRDAIETGLLNAARFRHMRLNKGDAPTDREMRQILSNVGAQFYQEAIAGGASPDEARMQAAQRLSEEYGI